MATPTDPDYGLQWHFDWLGDIETIWDEYTGVGVKVGVYDDGVEDTHADLNDNYDTSLEFEFDYDGNGSIETGSNIPASPITADDNHGTAVAGIIGAEANNGVGGTGIAPDVSLMSMHIFLSSATYPDEYDAYFAALAYGDIDIMNNSWGYTPLYDDYQNLSRSFSQISREVGQLETAAETGRGGLGTIIVQSAGNDSLNSNGDGMNASRHTITVAATLNDGYVASYSNFGAGILVAATAASVTTDRTGSVGYNNGSESQVDDNYTRTFGGTSAAAPTTSGVVSLMLDANENLGWRDVHTILALTAAQIGEELDGSNGISDEVGDWVTVPSGGGSSWNGGGLSFHASYGFGIVDAFAAVRMAEVWLDMFDTAQTSANEQHVTVDYNQGALGSVAIPDYNSLNPTNAGVVSLTVTEEILIEKVMVTVDIEHSDGRDLQIYLITPDGDEVALFFNEGSASLMDFGWTWTFEVTALLGFSTLGTWQLAVLDTDTGLTGEIDDFQIDFYGRTATNNDVHIIGRDFLDFTSFDPSRAVITDTNDGVDWLNFVGVNSDGIGNGDVVLNMAAGGAFSVDTTAWGTLQTGSDVFENAVLGDGGDSVTGNSLDNEIQGMRGDDTLSGEDGNDTLEGGAGVDSLVGGSGRDSLEGGDGNDTLEGGDNKDDLIGGAGDDFADGGAGNDRFIMGDGFDFARGGDGQDTLFGSNRADTLEGGDDDDRVDGGSGSDQLYGEEGNDLVLGRDGKDNLYGGNGDDWLIGHSNTDGLYGGKGNDSLEGGAGNDRLDGAGGQDTLLGGDDNDTLLGQFGNDTLDGGSGNDLLRGGRQDDLLTGGTGTDTFYFEFGMATDTVTDFEIGVDTAQFDDVLWSGDVTPPTDGASLFAEYGSTSGNDIIFNFGGSDIVTFQNALLGGSTTDFENDILIV